MYHMPEMSWPGACLLSEIDKTYVNVLQEDTYSGGCPIMTSEVSITVEMISIIYNGAHDVNYCGFRDLYNHVF